MSRRLELYEYEHYHKRYEDTKHNLYIPELHHDIQKWIDENIAGDYDLENDDVYYDVISIIFDDDVDAMAFKLRWL